MEVQFNGPVMLRLLVGPMGVLIKWEVGYYALRAEKNSFRIIWKAKNTSRYLRSIYSDTDISIHGFITVTNKKYGVTVQNSGEDGDGDVFCCYTKEEQMSFCENLVVARKECVRWQLAHDTFFTMSGNCLTRALENCLDESNVTELKQMLDVGTQLHQSRSCLSSELVVTIIDLVVSSGTWSQKLLNRCEMEQIVFDRDTSLGSGGFGKVFRADWKFNDELFPVAVKQIHSELSPLESPFDLTALRRELTILRLINHKNLLKYYGYILESPYYYIITELASCDLLHFLKEHPSVDFDTKRNIIRGICCGVSALHQLNIAHRDLKSENILIVS